MIINMTGGGSGVGGVLTVTAPAGVTVAVSKDGKTKRKTSNAEGLAVFKGLATGTWTLTITNGVQTSTKPVVITADYSTVIAFFAATININYPAGSICTCTDGTTTLTAPDTNGAWACIVPNTGTWTVTITNGTETKSYPVSITQNGQNETIELAYITYLYNRGDTCDDITGGWRFNMNQTGGKVGSITYNTDNVELKQVGNQNTFVTVNDLKLDKYNKLEIVYKYDLQEYDGPTFCQLGLVDDNTQPRPTLALAADMPESDVENTVELNISDVDTDLHVCVTQQYKGIVTIYEIRLS